MGWPALCFPKEEPKTGNGWGQQGTIWRNPLTPSCWGFPTSAAMERMRQKRRVVPTSTLGMGGDPAAPRDPHPCCVGPKVLLQCCTTTFASGAKRPTQPEMLLPWQSCAGPPVTWAQHHCAFFQAFTAQLLPQTHPLRSILCHSCPQPARHKTWVGFLVRGDATPPLNQRQAGSLCTGQDQALTAEPPAGICCSESSIYTATARLK